MSLLNQNFADDDAIEMSDDGMEDDDNDDSSGDGDLVKIKPSTQGGEALLLLVVHLLRNLLMYLQL